MKNWTEIDNTGVYLKQTKHGWDTARKGGFDKKRSESAKTLGDILKCYEEAKTIIKKNFTFSIGDDKMKITLTPPEAI